MALLCKTVEEFMVMALELFPDMTAEQQKQCREEWLKRKAVEDRGTT